MRSRSFRPSSLLLALFLAPLPLAAQSGMGGRQTPANPVLAALQPRYMEARSDIIRSAQQMPQEQYSYRPTEEVRTFGEILGHLVNEQYLFCAAAKSEDNPWQQDAEKITDKATMVDALTTAFEYCDDLYASMSEADLAAPSDAFGGRRSRLFWLIYNVAHDNLHYGNLITYFRLNGMVPPSSQPRGG